MRLDATVREILQAFADAYPTSAHYRGGRKLRLGGWSRRVPEIEDDVEEKEAFLRSVEELTSDGLLSVKWRRFRAGEEVEALYLEDPERLYALLGAKAPWHRRDELLSVLRQPPWTEPALATLRERLGALLDAHHPVPVEEATELRELGRLFLLRPEETVGLPIRALSVRLFNDSKRLERLLPTADKLSFEIEGERLSERIGLGRSYPEVTFALFGSLRLRAAEWELSGDPLTLPLQSVERISDVVLRRPEATGAPWVLSVENKESFYAVCEAAREAWAGAAQNAPPSAVLYTAGHPGEVVRTLLSVVAKSASAILHFGDIDPDGLLILQELAEGTGLPIHPFSMDEDTFRRYLRFGRALSEGSLARLKEVRLDELAGLAAL
ncbi:MAG: Wadjet anti-phage system protein JetD domain-containing protein, partial [Spirochaetaceae bacterium]